MNLFTPSTVDGVLVSTSRPRHRGQPLTETVPERPHIIPLYLSSSGFNFTSMTSYTNFCFMQYIRYSAFFGENGGLRDGLAETFWFYSQNLPTVALLLPRAGLCVTLLLSFSSANPEYVGLIEAGFNGRDTTFFRASDGTLTDYARGVLLANAAWTAWRALVLFISWYVRSHLDLCFTYPMTVQDRPMDLERSRLRGTLWSPSQMGGRRSRKDRVHLQ